MDQQAVQDELTISIGIFGNKFESSNLIGQGLGSPGTKSDILFYNRLDATLNQIFCALTPLDYPDKIKPFLQVLSLTKIHLLVIDVEKGLNAEIGEILLGMDTFHRDRAYCQPLFVITGISGATEWKLKELKNKLNKILNTTSLKKSIIFELRTKEDIKDLKNIILKLGEKATNMVQNHSYTKVLIDHAFPVKGIGTVILGMVDKGEVKVNQLLELTGFEGPSKKVIIRSIQKNDRAFKEAKQGDRVGLALKGKISPNEINRDNLLATPGIFRGEKQIKALIKINPFYKPKEEIITSKANMEYHAMVELKVSPFKFIEGEEIKPGGQGIMLMKFEKTLIHDGAGLKGIIMEMNKFKNKSRIVGTFSQIKN
ncbi:MAG: hypothetical protein ACTSU4_10845 [Promethearchaeota archaeon]